MGALVVEDPDGVKILCPSCDRIAFGANRAEAIAAWNASSAPPAGVTIRSGQDGGRGSVSRNQPVLEADSQSFLSPQEWADAAVAFIGCTMGGATIAEVARGRTLLDAMPADGLPRAWRDVGEMLGTWVRRREQLTRVVGFTLPKPMLDAALADMPQARQAWQDRKDVA